VREHLIFKEAVSAIKVPYWERRELLRLWDESERGSFDVVLVTEMFRIARFASEQFAVIEHLKRYNVRLESISEKFEDSAEGRLLMSIQGFLGEVEANKIKIRTSRGKFHRAKQALSGQGQPAYGYVWASTKAYSNAYYELSTRVFYDAAGNEWSEVKVVAWVYDGCLSGMSLRQMTRANKHPKDTIMRSLVFCGECHRRMHVKHYVNSHGNRTQNSCYKCARNDGISDTLHKHTISISCSSLDEEAWEFAKLHIQNPRLIHEYVEALHTQIPVVNHAESIEESIGKIDKAINNLYKLAEVAIDPEPLQERLIELQLKKRDLEKLHMGAASSEEKQEQLRMALDRFETWACLQRQFLSDPTYEVTLDDKLGAILFLGVKATVLGVNGHKKRVKLELMPPDIDRLLRFGCCE